MSDISQQLIEQVRAAVETKQALTIQGYGTKTFLGRELTADTPRISTADHSGIISYEPVELVMTARAGTTLAEIDAALNENNQMLACDPARFGGQASIGGSLAANQAGPGRPWLGSLRDHVLGVNLINGRGEALRFGGQVMKNVAGYDVSRLQAGAMGTLGLMTEISFKVLPKPAASLSLISPLSADEAIARMNQFAGQAKPLTGACWHDGQLYLRLEGATRAVEKTANQWPGEVMEPASADQFWRDLRDQQLHFFTANQRALWRFSAKSTAPMFLQHEPWLLDWAGSLRWLSGDFDASQLQAYAAQHGGECTLYRRGQSALSEPPVVDSITQTIQQKLKQSFDPHHIFNIGRLYDWM